jgi:hypothetical protein
MDPSPGGFIASRANMKTAVVDPLHQCAKPARSLQELKVHFCSQPSRSVPPGIPTSRWQGTSGLRVASQDVLSVRSKLEPLLFDNAGMIQDTLSLCLILRDWMLILSPLSVPRESTRCPPVNHEAPFGIGPGSLRSAQPPKSAHA